MITQEQILEIIQNNYNEYKGTNEAELHSSEEIYDLYFINNRQHLIDFFMFFRNNGEQMLGSTIEQLVDAFLEQYMKDND